MTNHQQDIEINFFPKFVIISTAFHPKDAALFFIRIKSTAIISTR